jgi:hypothetical protein
VQGGAGFVALQVTDQVPGDVGQIGEGLGFGLGFLDTAFPKIPQPQGVGVTDDRNWHLFGDCHQADVGGNLGLEGV